MTDAPSTEPTVGLCLDARQSDALAAAVRMLRSYGDGATADLVVQRLRAPARSAPTVVVVGEVKRGKSSLVNALLGAPGASPVGVDVTTGAFLRFVPATPQRPAGTAVLLTADGDRRPVSAAEVADWVAVGGRHRADPEAPLVRGAEVAVAGGQLPDVELVDTPGVGGLDGGHARLAAGAAAQATLLLFVCDAGQPLTAPELAFLTRVAQTVETVVLAMTKVDKHPAGWREVLAENRELLRRHAPRFADAPIVPVSGELAAEALRLPDGDTRRALAEAAGVAGLADVLRQRVGDADRLAVANTVRIARSGLDQVAAQLTARRGAAAGGAAERAGLEAERARLAELRARQQRWTLDLERDLGQLRRATVDDVVARLSDVRDRWTARADKERRGLVPSVNREFMAQLCSELEAVAQEVATGFEANLRRVVADTYGSALPPGHLLVGVDRELRDVRPRLREPRDRPTGLADPGLAATALIGGSMAVKLPIAAVVGAFPLAIAVGGAWLAVNVAYRAMKAGRVRLRTSLVEVVQSVQADLVAATDGCLREVKPEIVVGFRDFLAAAVAQVDASIRESERAAAASVDQRRSRVDTLDRTLVAVTEHRDLLDRLLREPPPPAEPPGPPAPAVPPAAAAGTGSEEPT